MSNTILESGAAPERGFEIQRLQSITNAKKHIKYIWQSFSHEPRWRTTLKATGEPKNNGLTLAGIEMILKANGFVRAPEWEPRNGEWAEALQVRSYLMATLMIRKARKARKPVKTYRPFWNAVQTNMYDANATARPILGNLVKFHHGIGGDHAGSIRISPMWSRMVGQIGGAVLGWRFITRAEKVDQVGGFDLFQVEYYTDPATQGPRWGYVAKLRGGTTRGFGDKAETALKWAERQVVVKATRKLAQ